MVDLSVSRSFRCATGRLSITAVGHLCHPRATSKQPPPPASDYPQRSLPLRTRRSVPLQRATSHDPHTTYHHLLSSRRRSSILFPNMPSTALSPSSPHADSYNSYSSSLSPTSPRFHPSSAPHGRRSPSPSRLESLLDAPLPSCRPSRSPRSRKIRDALARHIRPHLTPRTLTILFFWTLSVWFIHHFLFPISSLYRLSKPKAEEHFLSTAFPPPPQRIGDDHLDSVDPRWRAYHPLPAPDPPFPHLRPTRFLPPQCLEQWFADGETLCGAKELGEEEKLDATWLWVNGSDHRWRDSMIEWREKENVHSPERHFRCVELAVVVRNSHTNMSQ